MMSTFERANFDTPKYLNLPSVAQVDFSKDKMNRKPENVEEAQEKYEEAVEACKETDCYLFDQCLSQKFGYGDDYLVVFSKADYVE